MGSWTWGSQLVASATSKGNVLFVDLLNKQVAVVDDVLSFLSNAVTI
jgi:hypothetical protein